MHSASPTLPAGTAPVAATGAGPVLARPLTSSEVAHLDRLRAWLQDDGVDVHDPAALDARWGTLLATHPADAPAPAGVAAAIGIAVGDVLVGTVPGATWMMCPGPDGATPGVVADGRVHAPVLAVLDAHARWRVRAPGWTVDYVRRAAVHLGTRPAVPAPLGASAAADALVGGGATDAPAHGRHAGAAEVLPPEAIPTGEHMPAVTAAGADAAWTMDADTGWTVEPAAATADELVVPELAVPATAVPETAVPDVAVPELTVPEVVVVVETDVADEPAAVPELVVADLVADVTVADEPAAAERAVPGPTVPELTAPAADAVTPPAPAHPGPSPAPVTPALWEPVHVVAPLAAPTPTPAPAPLPEPAPASADPAPLDPLSPAWRPPTLAPATPRWAPAAAPAPVREADVVTASTPVVAPPPSTLTPEDLPHRPSERVQDLALRALEHALEHAVADPQGVAPFVLVRDDDGVRLTTFVHGSAGTLAAREHARRCGLAAAAVGWTSPADAARPYPRVVVDASAAGEPGIRVAHAFVHDAAGGREVGGPEVVGQAAPVL